MEKTKKQNPQMNQNQIENTNLQEKQFEKEAMKVSTVSIVVNVLLSLFKLLAGACGVSKTDKPNISSRDRSRRKDNGRQSN